MQQLISISFLALFFLSRPLISNDYTYYVMRQKPHVIHVVILHPDQYTIQFVKAHHQVFGRETLESLAQQSDADIAVNAGFFEMSPQCNGMPSRTLIIENDIFGLTPHASDYLQLRDHRLSIFSLEIPTVNATIADQVIKIHKINEFVTTNNEQIFYNSYWGKKTLTPFKTRTEIICDQFKKIVALVPHGNNDIPDKGFVLSLPQSFNTENINKESPVILDIKPKFFDSAKISMVAGIPTLVINGIINPLLLSQKQSPVLHARTAIGIKSNGEIVIVVAENHYSKKLEDITLGEIKAYFQQNHNDIKKIYHMSPNELPCGALEEILRKEYQVADGAYGLTIPELADVMIDLGCQWAINMDGGRSSSLWINGKIVNQVSLDSDDKDLPGTLRPISDAIVFKKKQKQ